MLDNSKTHVSLNCDSEIQRHIYTIRGLQVMLASDLADIYNVSTSVFNQAVKRNMVRFPDSFRFQLTRDELNEVITKCDNPDRLRFAPKAPFAFTEQGVAMLSGILRSNVAVLASIRIMNTFVAMRRTLASLGPLLSRIETTEQRQLKFEAKQLADQAHNEERFERIFQAMNNQKFPPQKVFYEGEVFDADVFITQYVLQARQSILLIDNWVDIGTLDILAKKSNGVSLTIVTSPKGNHLTGTDISKFNAQYGGLVLKSSTVFHDRFLIIDDKELFLVGASIKDLGKKCFAFSKLDALNIEHIKAYV